MQRNPADLAVWVPAVSRIETTAIFKRGGVVETSEFIKIAHKYLIFRDDWEFISTRIIGESNPERIAPWGAPKPAELRSALNQFRSSLERAAELQNLANAPVLILGPPESGKIQLAGAIAEADKSGTEPLILDCQLNDPIANIRETLNRHKGKSVVIIKEIEQSSSHLQRILVDHLDSRSIFTSTLRDGRPRYEELERRVRPELVEAIRPNTLFLPDLQHRLWDIIPFSVSQLVGPEDAYPTYISYTAMDFLLWYFWRTKSTTDAAPTAAKFRQILQELQRRSGADHMTIRLKDLEEFFPIGGKQQITEFPPMDIYNLIRNWPGPGYPLMAMGWPKIEEAFPRVEIARYILERCFLSKENHEVTPPRQEEWYHEKWQSSPPYRVREVLRQPTFLETGEEGFGRFLSWDWLRDQHIQKIKRLVGKPFLLSATEETLFDLRKMRGIFENMGILHPEQAGLSNNTDANSKFGKTHVRCTSNYAIWVVEDRKWQLSDLQTRAAKMICEAGTTGITSKEAESAGLLQGSYGKMSTIFYSTKAGRAVWKLVDHRGRMWRFKESVMIAVDDNLRESP